MKRFVVIGGCYHAFPNDEEAKKLIEEGIEDIYTFNHIAGSSDNYREAYKLCEKQINYHFESGVCIYDRQRKAIICTLF